MNLNCEVEEKGPWTWVNKRYLSAQRMFPCAKKDTLKLNMSFNQTTDIAPNRRGAASHWLKVVCPCATQWLQWFVPGHSCCRVDPWAQGLSVWSLQVLQVCHTVQTQAQEANREPQIGRKSDYVCPSLWGELPTRLSPIWGMPRCREVGIEMVGRTDVDSSTIGGDMTCWQRWAYGTVQTC